MNLKISPAAGLLFAVCLAVVSISLALSLSFCRSSEITDETHGGEKETVEQEKKVTTTLDYSYKIDISVYADAINTTDERYLLLANKSHLIGEDYLPKDIIDMDTSLTLYGKEISLVGNTAAAAEALLKELWANGYDNVYITSGYRSFAYQKTLYDKYIEREKKAHPDWSDSQIKDYVLTYSAYPGTSEHQSGLAIDLFVSPGMLELVNYGYETEGVGDIGFAETGAFDWLKQNAHKFGFVLRYPEDKVDVTGYSYESWHYRFVGINAATEIYEQGVTLEEYLGK